MPPSSEQLLEYARARLRVAVAARRSRGLLPFEGRWLTQSELRSELASRSRAQRIKAIELALAYLSLTLVALGFVALTVLIAY